MKTNLMRRGSAALAVLLALVVAGCAQVPPAPGQQQEVQALRQRVETLEAQATQQSALAPQPAAPSATDQLLDQMSQLMATLQGMAAMIPEASDANEIVSQIDQMQRNLDVMRQGTTDPEQLQSLMDQAAGVMQQMQNMLADGQTVTDMNQFMQQMDQVVGLMQNMTTEMPNLAGMGSFSGQINGLQQQMSELMPEGMISPQAAENVMGQAAGMMQQMGQAFGDLPAGALSPGGMMGGTAQPGGGGPATGSGRGMMGGQSGGMMGGFWRQPGAVSSPTPEQAEQIAQQYVAGFGPNLEVAEIMTFSNQYYVQARETDTGRYAFEFLIDRVTGAVYPEPGPNMMWNTKYGHMGRVSGQPAGEMTVSEDEAVQLAQQYLDRYRPELQADEHADAFYGYYTLHTLRDGEIAGMLSVNGYTGQVWYHTWHGEFEGMVLGEEH